MKNQLHSQRKAATRLAVIIVGRHICYGKDSGGGSAPAPDPAIGQAALKNAETGEKWLDFANKQFDVGNQRQQQMDDLTKQVVDQQMGTQQQQNQWAAQAHDRYLTTYQPLQDQFIQEAKNYGTPAMQEQNAASAGADVRNQAAIAQGTSARQMAAMGINPMSGRFQGIQQAGNLNTALATAGAENQARVQTRNQGMAMLGDAVNMGNGLPSNAATYTGLGLNAGNSAIGNQQTANNNFYANQGIMGQGYAGAMQGYGSEANILNGLYGEQLNAWNSQNQLNAQQSAGMGAGIGTLAMSAAVAF